MNSNSIRIALAILAVSFAMWQHEAAQAASSRACDAFARDYVRNASRQGQVVRRGVFGGLLGLGVGAATGERRLVLPLAAQLGARPAAWHGSAPRIKFIGQPIAIVWRAES